MLGVWGRAADVLGRIFAMSPAQFPNFELANEYRVACTRLRLIELALALAYSALGVLVVIALAL
jgi:hypothetical protein